MVGAAASAVWAWGSSMGGTSLNGSRRAESAHTPSNAACAARDAGSSTGRSTWWDTNTGVASVIGRGPIQSCGQLFIPAAWLRADAGAGTWGMAAAGAGATGAPRTSGGVRWYGPLEGARLW